MARIPRCLIPTRQLLLKMPHDDIHELPGRPVTAEVGSCRALPSHYDRVIHRGSSRVGTGPRELARFSW